MQHSHKRFHLRKAALSIAALIVCSAALCVTAEAQPTVQANYKLSVFAHSTMAYSQPDSIVRWRNSILVGYQNHVAKD
jgi:hypothetical protein